MNNEELQRILSDHAARLNGERADKPASLREAHLIGANLIGADLRGADLCEADLSGADLRGADLRGADLENVSVDESTAGYHLIPPETGEFAA